MRHVSCDQREFLAPDAFDFNLRLTRARVYQSRPETILRWTIYLHLLAILVCVGMILQELAYRHSNVEPPLAGIHSLLIVPPALLALVACPLAILLTCGLFSRNLTRRSMWSAITTMVFLVWFQVVWILGPCVGDASGARERQMREMEMRKKQP